MEPVRSVPNISLPRLPMQWKWLHGCVAVDSDTNHLVAVVNGEKVDDRKFPIREGTRPPRSLVDRLLFFKITPWQGVWEQQRGKVTNLNVYYGRMSVEVMVARTGGKDCGKADGDYLAWGTSQWRTNGTVTSHEVEVEDLCRKESNIRVFTERLGESLTCHQLCPDMMLES